MSAGQHKQLTTFNRQPNYVDIYTNVTDRPKIDCQAVKLHLKFMAILRAQKTFLGQGEGNFQKYFIRLKNSFFGISIDLAPFHGQFLLKHQSKDFEKKNVGRLIDFLSNSNHREGDVFSREKRKEGEKCAQGTVSYPYFLFALRDGKVSHLRTRKNSSHKKNGL